MHKLSCLTCILFLDILVQKYDVSCRHGDMIELYDHCSQLVRSACWTCNSLLDMHIDIKNMQIGVLNCMMDMKFRNTKLHVHELHFLIMLLARHAV